MKNYDLAKIAYAAYSQQTGGVSLISGDKLPDFWKLRPEIQDAWYAAAEAVFTALIIAKERPDAKTTP